MGGALPVTKPPDEVGYVDCGCRSLAVASNRLAEVTHGPLGFILPEKDRKKPSPELKAAGRVPTSMDNKRR